MAVKRVGESRPLVRKAQGSASGYESGGGDGGEGGEGHPVSRGSGKRSASREVEEQSSSSDPSLLKKILLPVYSVLLLLAATGNSICFKKMTNAMPNYPFFLMQVSTLVYVPVFGIVVETLRRIKGFNEETLKFPRSKFMMMALFDVVSGVMTLFGGVYTQGTTQMLLLQGAIPVTMICSFLLLRTRYEWMQYTGALVIVSGVFVVLSPKIFPSANAERVDPGNESILFNAIFFMANIPQSLSSVYKEVAFKDSKDLDIYYTQYWIAIYQAIFGFVVLPLNSLPFLGPMRLSLSELPLAIKNGVKCFMGTNSLVTNCYTDVPITGMKPCDACGGAWFFVVQYMIFNIQYNIFAILLIREGSAALLIIIMTLRLPLGNIAFYMPFIMGDDAQPFQSHDVSGLLVILIGLVIYRIQRSPESTQGDAPYVISSVVTLGPGVAEPITSQVQRATITMGRRVEDTRGELYRRLGLPPGPNYVHPTSDTSKAAAPHSASPRTPSAGFGGRQNLHRTVLASSAESPIVGVSPVARSAPFYFNLQRRKEEQVSSDEEEEEIDLEEDNPRGRPIP